MVIDVVDWPGFSLEGDARLMTPVIGAQLHLQCLAH